MTTNGTNDPAQGAIWATVRTWGLWTLQVGAYGLMATWYLLKILGKLN